MDAGPPSILSFLEPFPIAGVQFPNHDETTVERQAIALQGEAQQDHGR